MLDPLRWGLPPQVVAELPARLADCWKRYRACFWTRTRDQSRYAYHYLSGLLRMETNRNFSQIGRVTGQAGENLQHFMSNSPWSAQAVCRQVRTEIRATPPLQQGSVLILDESADAKAGVHSAGSARQHNGRLGKEDVCQVGVFLALANGHTWTWVDGALFLPEVWFTPEYAPLRQRAGVPDGWTFKTKVELGWEMIQQAQREGLPFEWMACDDLYGRAIWFRAKLAGTNIVYMADVPCNTQVYVERPSWGIPSRRNQRGKRPTKARILSPDKPVTVQQVAQRPDTAWDPVRVRSVERGELIAPYAARRVWTLRDEQPTEEWLVMRQEADGDIRYALSNAHAEEALERLAWMEAPRCFVERSIQDAKSELGWDEFQAQKLCAWEHQLALTVLASWFIAQTRLDWVQRFPPDPGLQEALDVAWLPALSMANVRELLRAAMPLPHLSEAEARQLVAKHLLNRTRSHKSRLRKQLQEVRSHTRDPA